MKVVRLSVLRIGRLYPLENIPGTHFCWRLSRPKGHGVIGRIMLMKNTNDNEIQPATFRTKAQRLNQPRHCIPHLRMSQKKFQKQSYTFWFELGEWVIFTYMNQYNCRQCFLQLCWWYDFYKIILKIKQNIVSMPPPLQSKLWLRTSHCEYRNFPGNIKITHSISQPKKLISLVLKLLGKCR
jgi:hypothetical protein